MKWSWPIFFFCFQAVCLSDQSVTLAWNPNSEPDVVGYVVYYGTISRMYPNATKVGNTTTATIHGLPENTTHFFAITALNMAGLESEFSDEITNSITDEIQRFVLVSLEVSKSFFGPWSVLMVTNIPEATGDAFFRAAIKYPDGALATNNVAYYSTTRLERVIKTEVGTNEVPPIPR